jgi:DNA (cytosine-5)-methyltransferase 1
MNVLSLFAGIGGLELGLERAGMTVVGQVEINPFSRSVLATHWPDVPRHDDVRTCLDWWTSVPRHPVHVVAGGFQCQPFASAGRQLGTGDDRWGWPYMFHVIRGLRPHYVIVENVPGLLSWGDGEAFARVLSDLADVGFDAEWSVLSACAVGAPHTRERLFLVAHANGLIRATGLGLGAWHETAVRAGTGGDDPWRADPLGLAPARPHSRMADGLSDGLEPARVTAVGNALVPQLAELIGRAIIRAEHDNGDYRA